MWYIWKIDDFVKLSIEDSNWPKTQLILHLYRMVDGMVDFGCLCSVILQNLMKYSKRFISEDCINYVVMLKIKDIVLYFSCLFRGDK